MPVNGNCSMHEETGWYGLIMHELKKWPRLGPSQRVYAQDFHIAI